MLRSLPNYVKTVLEFSGYDNYEAFLSIKDHNDLQPAFKFVKENKDLLSGDEDLGIFKKNPAKLMLLPGHIKIVDKFIENLKSHKRRSLCEPQAKRTKITTKRCDETSSGNKGEVIINTLLKNMEIWFSSLSNAESLAALTNFSSPMETVHFDLVSSPIEGLAPTPTFTCQVCKSRLTITRCKSRGVYILSNVQRHINRNCWIGKKAKTGHTTNQNLLFFYTKDDQHASTSSSSSSSSSSTVPSTLIIGDDTDEFVIQTEPTIVAQDLIGETEVSFTVGGFSDDTELSNTVVLKEDSKNV